MTKNKPARKRSSKRGAKLVKKSFGEVTASKVEWLWKGFLAVGAYTLLAGVEGLGKSFLCCWLSKIVTRGLTSPDGTKCPIGSVILINQEDAASEVRRPRLDYAGADVNKVFQFQKIEIDENGKQIQTGHFNMSTDIHLLRELIIEIGDVLAVIIDPVGSAVGHTNTNQDNEIRMALTPLVELSGEFGFSLLLIAHYTKAGAGRADDTILGSKGFVALARSVWHTYFETDLDENGDPEKRLLLPGKNNLTAKSKQLGYSFTIVSNPEDENVGRLHWLRDRPAMTANHVATARLMHNRKDSNQGKPGRNPDQILKAQDLLIQKLAQGPVAAVDLFQQLAEEHDISERTVRRAKDAINDEWGFKYVSTKRDGKRSVWKINPNLLPDAFEAAIATLKAKRK